MIQKNSKFVLFIVILMLLGSVGISVIFAQTSPNSSEDQAQLQQQLQEIEKQIGEYQQQLSQIQNQKNTLSNKLKQLKKQQDLLNLQVQATNLQINDIGGKINDTQTQINQNNEQVQLYKNQVAELIRIMDQKDGYPLVYSVIAQKSLSDAFDTVNNYSQISQNLTQLGIKLKQANVQLQQQQQDLALQQQDAENLLSIKVLQQSQLGDTVSQQNSLLKQTKGKEADYQIVLNDTKAQAAAIRSRLYQLLGISSQITFGQALEIAQWAQGATGIDPAFLLAVLTQESNLGQNVGTCNRPGDPPEKSWKVVMKPSRDQQPFLQITGDLGMNPDVTPVSCPMHDKTGKQVGWGGAMGPAQFIPSTWVGYADKVAALTGHSPANPWDIRDAFAAAAIKLVAGGADGTEQGNWNAAMRYFSGSTNPRFRFYGDSVLATAAKYRADINNLNN